MHVAKEIGGPRQILECELEKELLSRESLLELRTDSVIVGGAPSDRVIEDRRIGRKSRHRELADVAREGCARQELPRDVIQPEALAAAMEQFCRFHE